MKEEANTTLTAEQPPAKRKVLAFYFDRFGEIHATEEGLSKTERLALLNFGREYCGYKSKDLFFQVMGND